MVFGVRIWVRNLGLGFRIWIWGRNLISRFGCEICRWGFEAGIGVGISGRDLGS